MDVRQSKDYFTQVIEGRPRTEEKWRITLNFIKLHTFPTDDIWHVIHLIDLSWFGGELETLEKSVTHTLLKKLVEGINPGVYKSNISQPNYLLEAEVRFALYASALYLKKNKMRNLKVKIGDLAGCMSRSLFYLKTSHE